ncbi:MAG: zinc-ribbon domain containing protein [Phycisphaerae bacterium]|nr:zinc-ribbon domain containing protein [Phycisphaerae bacterium]
MSFEDKTIVCSDCGQNFIHSAQDQARYAQRGFTNEPKRCRECRDKRKAQGGGRSGGAGGNRGADGGRGDRARRESFPATCAECGAQTTVPFKPVQDRPVYCQDCFRSRKR